MNANVICEPPLGQTTVFSQQWARFVILLEFPEPQNNDEIWDVAVWHNGHPEQEWGELLLDRIPDQISPEFNNLRCDDRHRLYFTGTVDRVLHQLYFTIKFRSVSQGWTWVKEHSGLEDGHICFQTAAPISEDLSEYISDIPPQLSVTSHEYSPAEAKLWSITGPVEGARDLAPGILNISIGKPRDLISFFSLVRVSVPWLAPRQGKHWFSLTEEAILCSFLLSNGLHLVLLAVSVADLLTTIISGNGNIAISARNDQAHPGRAIVVATVGRDFESANDAVVSAARRIVSIVSHHGEIPNYLPEIPERYQSVERFSSWTDGLTYCTWNGLGQDLTEDKIYHALDSLRDSGVLVTNLIIDDNWQSLDNPGANQYKRGWSDFEANKEGFPRGLKHLTSTIRQNYANIKHIAVWHGLFGYWGGFSPDGNITRKYKSKQVQKIAEGFGDGEDRLITVVGAEDVRKMCYDFYDFLARSGVDSVKIDNQYHLDCLKHPQDRRDLIEAYQDAWRDASLEFFRSEESYRVISCMSLIPQTIFHSYLSPPSNVPQYTLRNSDDFFPDDPTSHKWHIYCNAHCAVLTHHFHTFPDYDMFQTTHHYSGFHAAARSISGGPIYFTDKPGEHDIGLINQISAPTITGERVILRPNTVGKSMQVYSGHRERQFTKLGAFHYIVEPFEPFDTDAREEMGSSILGIFNTAPASGNRTEFIRDSDFHFSKNVDSRSVATPDSVKYIIRSHTTDNISAPVALSHECSNERDNIPNLIPVTLAERGYEILTAYELQSFSIPSFTMRSRDPASSEVFSLLEAPNTEVIKRSERVSSTLYMSPLGLLGKMTSTAALTSAECLAHTALAGSKGTHSATGYTIQEIKALGRVATYYLVSASQVQCAESPEDIRINTRPTATIIGRTRILGGAGGESDTHPVRSVNSVPQEYITAETVLDDHGHASMKGRRKAGVVAIDLERAWAEMPMDELVKAGHENGHVRVRIEISVEVLDIKK